MHQTVPCYYQKIHKFFTPTEISRDLPGKMMPESAKTSCRKSLNFDRGSRDESSADRENATVHPCKETGTTLQEVEVGLACDMKAFMKQDIDVALRVVGAAAVKLLTSLGGLAFDGKINNNSMVFFLNSQCFNSCPQEIAGSASFEDFLLRKLKVLQG
ncbi:hypothetical protein KIW84_022568 [Lathyrus oleraceus]|uniref:Uncharacterized protein n=1 Tax=Pisum sativum TaxID=3888 RepID=A0A9D4YCT9_PEA|nr:hypothetical protein KIW84_022568 [Pisum sativum]